MGGDINEKFYLSESVKHIYVNKGLVNNVLKSCSIKSEYPAKSVLK